MGSRAVMALRGPTPRGIAGMCVTRSGRVAFLRRRHKNAECVNRVVRYPGRCPGLWATTGLTARLDCILGRVPLWRQLGQLGVFYKPAVRNVCLRRKGKWLGRAESPNVALSPGQRPG